MRHRSLGLLVLAILPLSGCCSMARLFCGPDRSKWVSVRYDTPEATVATFLEAMRRDDGEEVTRCLNQECLARLGLDSFTAQVAWRQLREQNPGLHLVGYAVVPVPTLRTEQSATFQFEVEGNRLRLDLVRESYWELTYRRPTGTVGGGLHPVASWSAIARIETIEHADPERSRLVIEPLAFEHGNIATVPIDAIERAGLVRMWKIAGLSVQPAP